MYQTSSLRFKSSTFILILLNVSIWAWMLLLMNLSPKSFIWFLDHFALIPRDIWHGEVYQLFTYMFLHDFRDPMHILFNMIAVYYLAPPLDAFWGSRKTIALALASGVGGGVMALFLQTLGTLFFGQPSSFTIGFSGAVMGMLAVFSLMHPRAKLLLFFVLPIEARYILPIALGIDFFLWAILGIPISFPAHFGGALTGLLWITGLWHPQRLKFFLNSLKYRKSSWK